MEPPPGGAVACPEVSSSGQFSTTPEAVQEVRSDVHLHSESEAVSSQQENVAEPMQHDTPYELKDESEELKEAESVSLHGTGNEQVNTAGAVDHVANKLVDGSETVGSQQESVPEAMQQDTPEEKLKHESEALASTHGTDSEQINSSETVDHTTNVLADASKTVGSQQESVPEAMQQDPPDEKLKHESAALKSTHGTDSEQISQPEAVDRTTNVLADASKAGSQQANLPQPKQRDRPDDEPKKREKNVEKKVRLVFPGHTGDGQVNLPESAEPSRLFGPSASLAGKAKRNTSVITLKDIEAKPWYTSSDAKYSEAIKEGHSAVTLPWTKVALWKGDITKLEVDAIVNAANSRLMGGGGVDGAIHAAAGPKLKEECRTLKYCAPGDAKITKGYNLPAKHVIHTVGPMDGNPEVLRRCYDRCFELMTEHKLKSVAFPCIATGIYGFPNDDAADIALSAAREWLDRHHAADVEKVVFCVFLPQDFELYKEKLPLNFKADDVWNIIDEAAKNSNPSDAKGDVGSQTSSVQLTDVHPVDECAGMGHAGDNFKPGDTEAAAAAHGTDASNVPASSTAAKPAGIDEVASSVTEAAIDACDQPPCNDGYGCSV